MRFIILLFFIIYCNILLAQNNHYDTVTIIYLRGRNITNLPDSIYKYKNLKNIDLSNNPNLKINNALNKLNKFYSIEHLDLSDNGLKSIPDQIFLMNNLKSINLQGNLIKNISVELFFLDSMKFIDLSNNEITKICSNNIEYKEASSLKELDISLNNLSEFPKIIYQFLELEKLYINDNRIMYLSDSITILENLLLLNVAGNKLRKIPYNLNLLKRLKFVEIESNCISAKELKNISTIYSDSQISFLLGPQKNCMKE